jgi:hypothetical protein
MWEGRIIELGKIELDIGPLDIPFNIPFDILDMICGFLECHRWYSIIPSNAFGTSLLTL